MPRHATAPYDTAPHGTAPHRTACMHACVNAHTAHGLRAPCRTYGREEVLVGQRPALTWGRTPCRPCCPCRPCRPCRHRPFHSCTRMRSCACASCMQMCAACVRAARASGPARAPAPRGDHDCEATRGACVCACACVHNAPCVRAHACMRVCTCSVPCAPCWCHSVPRYAMPGCAMPCRAVPRRAATCCALPQHAVLCSTYCPGPLSSGCFPSASSAHKCVCACTRARVCASSIMIHVAQRCRHYHVGMHVYTHVHRT